MTREGEKATDLQLLERIRAAGVYFIISVGDGQASFEPADVMKFVSDPDQFLADYHGVSLDAYQTWKRFDGRCRGINRKGRPCMMSGLKDPTPKYFIPGKSDYCEHHKDQG